MKINKTLAYGLCCLHYLDKYGKNRWVEVKDISKYHKLPYAYCNKVMQALVHSGIVMSQKGKGFKLIKDLDDVGVWQLMEAFTFNSAPDIEDNDISVKLYNGLMEQVNKWLVGLSVKDIIESVENFEDKDNV